MANLLSENSVGVNANNQQRPDQAGPSGASGGGERVNGGDDGGLPFRYIGTSAQNTFQYLRKRTVKKSSASRGGRNVEGQWTPFVFQLIPPEDNNSNVEKSELYKNIRLAGGTNYPGEDVETDVNGVLRILNEDYFVDDEGKDCLVPLDTYSSAFVYRCITNRNKGLPMPDPSKYLIPSSTSKYASYDARRVLRRELDWEDIDKLVFPPNQKRISAQQWIVELRRLRAEVMGNPQNHPDARKIINGPTTRTKVDVPNGQVRQVVDTELGNASSTQPQPRKRSREPDDAEKDKSHTLNPSPKRREVHVVATRLSSSPPPSSNGLSDVQESGDIESEPVAGPSRLHYASSTFKPRRLQFQRLDVANESGASASTSSRKDSQKSANGIQQRAKDPPIPQASSPKPSTSSTAIAQSPPTRPAAVSAHPPPRAPSPKPSTSSKTNGNLATTSQTATSSALPSPSPSSKNANVTNRPKINLKDVATAGPSGSRRCGPKPKPTPVRDDGWIDCDRPNGRSSDDSVHFSDNPDDDDDDEDVDVKPKLQPLWARLYNIEEGQRLLDLICAHNAFRYVNGIKFWKLVEGSKKFKTRTYQSLKNHFLKSIVPRVTSHKKHLASMYKISREDLVKLKEGVENKSRKFSNVCPDFEI